VLLSKCEFEYSEKNKVMRDLEEASQYILDLEAQIHAKNSTSLELLK
jgi:septal ring factor EnvC (AmiA/AmiB activator)